MCRRVNRFMGVCVNTANDCSRGFPFGPHSVFLSHCLLHHTLPIQTDFTEDAAYHQFPQGELCESQREERVFVVHSSQRFM